MYIKLKKKSTLEKKTNMEFKEKKKKTKIVQDAACIITAVRLTGDELCDERKSEAYEKNRLCLLNCPY